MYPLWGRDVRDRWVRDEARINHYAGQDKVVSAMTKSGRAVSLSYEFIQTNWQD